ncbi:volume-regulated anion channel subunit LRRC8D-like [Polypterus senegalus]|uniref:volume-regulated anion channel subunit LRRC8D-like n=1 Tax=Polypterus senegalus TaxID=55291 RepID=UPI001965F74E|nr:volume-regulated anion channel subunit LRRC8D-like [Polypterus senegalus]
MFALSEVSSLSETQTTFKILKPWWDVFMEYLVFVMLMVSIFAGTLMISKDQVVCLPQDYDTPTNASAPTPGPQNETSVAPKVAPTQAPAQGGRPTNLDYQQYIYISHVCYQKAIPWYSRYSAYVILIHSILLMVSSNFWFKYPKTSSKIEHFISILGKCFESPWTSKALSETACEESETCAAMERLMFSSMPSKSRGANVFEQGYGRLSKDLGAGTPLWAMASMSQLARASCAAAAAPPSPVDNPVTSGPPSMTILDKKDGEQAKALFEKVRKFRMHTEDGDLVYKIYVGQTLFKVLKFLLILGYMSTFVESITFEHVCRPHIRNLTGYSEFFCTHNMAFMLRKLLITYMALVCLYGLTGIYTLFWIFCRSLKEYSFEKLREESGFSDVPDVKNDFAFLLHMVDQYDQLYSKRFAVFLSEVSENKLLEENLNHEWSFDKLRQHVCRNVQGKLELQLFMLSGIPKAIFEMTDLEVLKLELIPEAKLPAKISQMSSLREIYLYHCPAKVEPIAFSFLRDHLKVLHVKFTDIDEIPSWIYSLRGLEQLYLSGNLNSENNKVIALDSLRELKHLKVLHLKSNITKVPSGLVEVASHLTELSIQNDGAKLLVFSNLKKAGNLTELELLHCQLEHIPHAIFSLSNLQKLDLKGNAICTIEEIVSLQHLRRMTCLKLWHNSIVSVPPAIALVRNLEYLTLSHNCLTSVPVALFTLKKLRHLDLGSNLIVGLPKEVGELDMLNYFSISNNKLEMVPPELFQHCSKLKTLSLADNCLTAIPPEVGLLLQITYLDLQGNSLESLPVELAGCVMLKKAGFLVEDELFNTLPSDVRENFLETDYSSPVWTGISPRASLLPSALCPVWQI